MKEYGNGKFIKFIFWTLIIGSFGWATVIGATMSKVHADDMKDLRIKDATTQNQIYTAVLKQQSTNEDIKLLLREIQTEQRIVKELIKNRS